MMLYTLAGRGGGVCLFVCVGFFWGGGVVVVAGLSIKIIDNLKPHITLIYFLTPSKLCGAIPQSLPMLTKRSVCKLAPPTKDGILYKCP